MNDEYATEGQVYSIRGLLDACTSDELTHPARMYILSNLTSREIHSSSEILLREWQVIRNAAYPNWRDKDWKTLNPDFKARVMHFYDQYRESELGQMRLF